MSQKGRDSFKYRKSIEAKVGKRTGRFIRKSNLQKGNDGLENINDYFDTTTEQNSHLSDSQQISLSELSLEPSQSNSSKSTSRNKKPEKFESSIEENSESSNMLQNIVRSREKGTKDQEDSDEKEDQSESEDSLAQGVQQLLKQHKSHVQEYQTKIKNSEIQQLRNQVRDFQFSEEQEQQQSLSFLRSAGKFSSTSTAIKANKKLQEVSPIQMNLRSQSKQNENNVNKQVDISHNRSQTSERLQINININSSGSNNKWNSFQQQEYVDDQIEQNQHQNINDNLDQQQSNSNIDNQSDDNVFNQKQKQKNDKTKQKQKIEIKSKNKENLETKTKINQKNKKNSQNQKETRNLKRKLKDFENSWHEYINDYKYHVKAQVTQVSLENMHQKEYFGEGSRYPRRNRIKTLCYWANERPLYEEKGSGLELVGMLVAKIQEPYVEPQIIPSQSKKKLVKNNKIKKEQKNERSVEVEEVNTIKLDAQERREKLKNDQGDLHCRVIKTKGNSLEVEIQGKISKFQTGDVFVVPQHIYYALHNKADNMKAEIQAVVKKK